MVKDKIDLFPSAGKEEIFNRNCKRNNGRLLLREPTKKCENHEWIVLDAKSPYSFGKGGAEWSVLQHYIQGLVKMFPNTNYRICYNCELTEILPNLSKINSLKKWFLSLFGLVRNV